MTTVKQTPSKSEPVHSKGKEEFTIETVPAGTVKTQPPVSHNTRFDATEGHITESPFFGEKNVPAGADPKAGNATVEYLVLDDAGAPVFPSSPDRPPHGTHFVLVQNHATDITNARSLTGATLSAENLNPMPSPRDISLGHEEEPPPEPPLEGRRSEAKHSEARAHNK